MLSEKAGKTQEMKTKLKKSSYFGYPSISLKCLYSFIDVLYNAWMLHADDLTGWNGVPRGTSFMQTPLVHFEI